MLLRTDSYYIDYWFKRREIFAVAFVYLLLCCTEIISVFTFLALYYRFQVTTSMTIIIFHNACKVVVCKIVLKNFHSIEITITCSLFSLQAITGGTCVSRFLPTKLACWRFVCHWHWAPALTKTKRISWIELVVGVLCIIVAWRCLAVEQMPELPVLKTYSLANISLKLLKQILYFGNGKLLLAPTFRQCNWLWIMLILFNFWYNMTSCMTSIVRIFCLSCTKMFNAWLGKYYLLRLF